MNILKRSLQYKKKVAVTTTSFAEYDRAPIAILEDGGIEVAANHLKRKMEKEEIAKLCGECSGIIAGTESYDRDLLQRLPHLKVISRCGVGVDNIDSEAAKKLGIKVLNTPDGPTLAVAELTIGLMLDLLRKISQMDRGIRSGNWKKEMGNLLSNKKIGIIGFGRIGSKVAELLKPFGCSLAYSDIFVSENSMSIKRLPLDDLLKSSDIISIHVSGNSMVIGEKELGLMKRGSWLINVSRGGIVDEDALCSRLKEGYLSGAALDVFDREPYKGPLMEIDNVILTPHIGSYAKEARVEMELQAVKNLLKGLEE